MCEMTTIICTHKSDPVAMRATILWSDETKIEAYSPKFTLCVLYVHTSKNTTSDVWW